MPSPPPPPPKTQKYFFYYFIRFSFFVKIQNSLTRELTVIRVVGLPSPPRFPQLFFLSDLVLAPSSLHQPPPDKGHTVRDITELRAYFAPLAVLLLYKICRTAFPPVVSQEKTLHFFSFFSTALSISFKFHPALSLLAFCEQAM